MSLQSENGDATGDYTTKAELEGLMKGQPLQKDYQVASEFLVGMSCTEFFETYFDDKAEHPLSEFYANRGE